MTKQEMLTQWVKLKHQGQIVKKTNEPYFNHLLFVANSAAGKTRFGYEVGLCHDLIEKTDADGRDLLEALILFGYLDEDAKRIADEVKELTDVFTKTSYPNLSKAERKKREEERLTTISAEAQTVKYADLIYNVQWVMTYDRSDAELYLQRKRKAITNMTAGDRALRQEAIELIDKSLSAG